MIYGSPISKTMYSLLLKTNVQRCTCLIAAYISIMIRPYCLWLGVGVDISFFMHFWSTGVAVVSGSQRVTVLQLSAAWYRYHPSRGVAGFLWLGVQTIEAPIENKRAKGTPRYSPQIFSSIWVEIWGEGTNPWRALEILKHDKNLGGQLVLASRPTANSGGFVPP
jgi:hypothetical protein